MSVYSVCLKRKKKVESIGLDWTNDSAEFGLGFKLNWVAIGAVGNVAVGIWNGLGFKNGMGSNPKSTTPQHTHRNK